MVGLTNAILLARLAILPFAPLVCLMFWLALRYRTRFSRNQAIRLLQATAVGVVLASIVMVQRWVYSAIVQNPRAVHHDYFVTFVVVAECSISIFLIFRTALRIRKEKSSETSV